MPMHSDRFGMLDSASLSTYLAMTRFLSRNDTLQSCPLLLRATLARPFVTILTPSYFDRLTIKTIKTLALFVTAT